MKAELVVPVLNVSSIEPSFAWFAKLGWRQGLRVGSRAGRRAGVRLGACATTARSSSCLDGQGGRGEHGAWMSVWVDDVDAVHERCLREGLEVTHGPVDEVWHVREGHVRHPDGHILRISRALGLG